MKKIGIIDYGMGNLHSVTNALSYLSIDSFASGNISALQKADALILPGVGAFPDAMDCINAKGLTDFIRQSAGGGVPLLGICLGMQLLFDHSCEGRECDGLGLIPGEIVKLSAYEQDRRYKIPHMGWNALSLLKPQSAMLRGQNETPYVYFVHSFKAVPENREDIIAVTEYGEEICAAVSHANVYGTQFHPEKSESTGLKMLSAFADLI